MTDLNELAPALVAFQAAVKPLTKSATNPAFGGFNYVPLDAIMTEILPQLTAQKLAVSQFVTNIGGQSAIRTILLHASGQFLEDVAPLLLPRNDPQGQGSAITYARRYGVMAVLGLVADKDDDGNAATQSYNRTETYSEEQPAPPENPLFEMRRKVQEASGGMTPEEIAKDYTKWSGGLTAGAASVPQLQEYRDHLLGKS